MHRDLKLENVLVTETGFLKIIDYGLAKTLKEGELSKTFCGTPEYLAPEMVAHQGHDFSVDWWAVGILIYEMLIGVTPFYNRERKLLLLKIKQSKVVFPDKNKYKIDYSEDFVDVVMRLLDKDKKTRLGSNGDADEIMKHPFFASININKLMNETIDVPLKQDFTANQNKEGFNAKFFNSKSSPQDLTETVLPQANRDKLKKNEKAFDKFSSTS
jgi:serine/threonine protein kinase|tara:strand:+ start:350 stop:991 length:642 start_codon:yes stop_codon:yes gene_type:complete